MRRLPCSSISASVYRPSCQMWQFSPRSHAPLMGLGKQIRFHCVLLGRTWREWARRCSDETAYRVGSRSSASGWLCRLRRPVFPPAFRRDLRAPRGRRPRLSLPGLGTRALSGKVRRLAPWIACAWSRRAAERSRARCARAGPQRGCAVLTARCHARYVSLARMLSAMVMMTMPSPKVSRPSQAAQLSSPSCPSR